MAQEFYFLFLSGLSYGKFHFVAGVVGLHLSQKPVSSTNIHQLLPILMFSCQVELVSLLEMYSSAKYWQL